MHVAIMDGNIECVKLLQEYGVPLHRDERNLYFTFCSKRRTESSKEGYYARKGKTCCDAYIMDPLTAAIYLSSREMIYYIWKNVPEIL